MENKLYAVGGQTLQYLHAKAEQVLSTVEVYDPNLGSSWNFIAPMNDERQSAGENSSQLSVINEPASMQFGLDS
jgi:hypothetical protein